jgi:hypothetical protein
MARPRTRSGLGQAQRGRGALSVDPAADTSVPKSEKIQAGADHSALSLLLHIFFSGRPAGEHFGILVQ